MTYETKLEMIIEGLYNVLDNELIEIHNNYCIANTYMDDYIYNMSELDDVLQGNASDILSQIDIAEFDINDRYFIDTIYGYRSFGYACSDACEIDVEAIAKYILDNDDELGNGEILTVLDEIAVEEEEEENN